MHLSFLYYLVLPCDGTLTCHDWNILHLLDLVEGRQKAAAESFCPIKVNKSDLLPYV